MLWDRATRGSCGVFEGHSGTVHAVVFSPDGKLVASALDDKTVRLWDTATGGSCGVLEGHSGSVRAVVFSPDGKLVASASDDKTVRLSDVIQKTIVEETHIGASIRCLAFSDGVHLHTDWSVITLTSHLYPSPTTQATPTSAPYATDEWVTWNMEKVLVLPHVLQCYGSCGSLALPVLKKKGKIPFFNHNISFCCPTHTLAVCSRMNTVGDISIVGTCNPLVTLNSRPRQGYFSRFLASLHPSPVSITFCHGFPCITQSCLS